MSIYGYDDLQYRWKPSGGSYSDISPYIDEPTNAKVKAILEDFKPVGEIWVAKKDTGARTWDGSFVLGGLYDDTAVSGPDVLFFNGGANLGAAGTLEITWGGSNVTEQPCRIEDYERAPAQDKNTRFKVTLAQDGAPVSL